MVITAKHIIIFRQGSPLALIFQKLIHQTYGDKDHPHQALACATVGQGLPGFLEIQIEHADLKTPIPAQIPYSEILAISDAQDSDQQQIGFLRE